MPQITSTAAPDGSITYFNQFFLDYSGLNFTESLEHGWETVIKPEMMDEVKRTWEHSMATGEDVNIEIQLKRKSDNMYRWHLSRALAIRDEEGTITMWVGVAIDIHDQKTKEESKDDFISIASHELKTPLTTAKALVQLLQMNLSMRTPLDETSHDKNLLYAQKAGASLDRLTGLIGELLDTSKMKSDNFDLNNTEFDFNEMISSAIESVQYTSPLHRIVKSGEISGAVTGDKERLKQVVINLLTNAVKYSPEADKVLVTAVHENGEVKVSVKDSGIGIRKENLEKIFERYHREEQRVANFQGLGIGLYISYEIIHRHKGKLWAESEPGKGSTFYFAIPISYEKNYFNF
jgi:PAS domain S-box-containing protein